MGAANLATKLASGTAFGIFLLPVLPSLMVAGAVVGFVGRLLAWLRRLLRRIGLWLIHGGARGRKPLVYVAHAFAVPADGCLDGLNALSLDVVRRPILPLMPLTSLSPFAANCPDRATVLELRLTLVEACTAVLAYVPPQGPDAEMQAVLAHARRLGLPVTYGEF